ncbi:MAG TPA: hypothetical protein VG328_10160 [Stellaceae bacterium]|nr:hypothetical protein [Stellaceae bacterium]
MLKLSTAFAASALLMALSAPSFAADVGSSSPRGSSATIQNQNDLNAGASTSKSGANAQMNDKDTISGSTSRGSTMDRDQSAQLPKANQDNDTSGPGRSGTSPGHEMQEHGPVPGSPGASGYAPGHTDVK